MVTLCMQFICALFWGQDYFHSFRVMAGSHDFRAATSSSNIPSQFWLLKRLRGPSKLNRGVLGSRRSNSPSWTILAGEQLETPNPAVPLALVVILPSPVGLLPGRPRPCVPPFPTAPPPFRPRSASVPDDPSPGRPPPPPPRAGAASRASGVAESASSRRCREDGTRQDRAGGHGESGPRLRAHRLEPASAAGAMDRAPAEQVRECPGCSRASGAGQAVSVGRPGEVDRSRSVLSGDKRCPCYGLECIPFMKRLPRLTPCF